MAEAIQKFAKKLELEGALHTIAEDQIKIIVCGSKDNIDAFVDALYKEGATRKQFSLSVEPFLKDKDYRGVFRIIV
jgi:acylphosphatase